MVPEAAAGLAGETARALAAAATSVLPPQPAAIRLQKSLSVLLMIPSWQETFLAMHGKVAHGSLTTSVLTGESNKLKLHSERALTHKCQDTCFPSLCMLTGLPLAMTD